MIKLQELVNAYRFLSRNEIPISIERKKNMEGNNVVRLKIDNRVIMYEGSTPFENLDQEIVKQLLFTGLDMFLDDELWARYREKQAEKLNET